MAMESSSWQRGVALEDVVSMLETEFDGAESKYQHERLETDSDSIASEQVGNSGDEQKNTGKKRAKA